MSVESLQPLFKTLEQNQTVAYCNSELSQSFPSASPGSSLSSDIMSRLYRLASTRMGARLGFGGSICGGLDLKLNSDTYS